jgi:hypothetical protein
MTALRIQRSLASVFLLLGGWCLLAPAQVERLALRPEYVIGNATSALLMGCFGAQAVLAGVVILCSRFTPRTFLVFGLAGSLPFVCFNYYFYFVQPMFTAWMLLDFVGNIAILSLCLAGWRMAKQEASRRIAATAFLIRDPHA